MIYNLGERHDCGRPLTVEDFYRGHCEGCGNMLIATSRDQLGVSSDARLQAGSDSSSRLGSAS